MREIRFTDVDFWEKYYDSIKHDRDGVAGIQYRIGKSKLDGELNRIGKQRKADMRMHNTLKQRFVTKYGKLTNTDQNTDAADVKMYETHNPGFCFRRNGECRIPQLKLTSPSLNFANIHSLLFTDGQVDIEKVLCLHLLSAHKTETLKPPTKYHRALSFLAREQSPLERLIERSRKKRQDSSLSQLLPTYILDLKKPNSPEEGTSSMRDDSDIVINDGRLAARVIINDKICQLVHTVMSALQDTNPEKMEKLLKIAKDPELITKMIDKPHIQKFINMLNGHLLIYSCDSFHLTQPFKANTTPLYVDTKSKGLTTLVSQIRKNVLQLPADSTWRNLYDKSQATTSAESAEEVKVKHSHEKSKKGHENQPNKNFIKRNKKNVSASTKSAPNSSRGQNVKSEKYKNLRLPKFMAFINETPKRNSIADLTKEEEIRRVDAKNSDSDVSGSSKNSETYLPTVYNIFKNVDIETMATVLSDKAAAAHKRDLEDLDNTTEENTSSTTSSTPSHFKLTKPCVKRTKCYACLMKWQTPLPNPKIPTISKKVKIPNLDQSNYIELKTGSTYNLSLMIDKEMKRLNNEKSAKGSKNIVIPARFDFRNKSSLFDNYVDGVELDVLDLAKINQEIREKETTKKLDDFLNSRL